MSHPIIVIELIDNEFEALYSNVELSFHLVNRKGETDEPITISGPHAATLETANLSTVVDGITLPQEELDQRGENPFFGAEERPLEDVD
jgi:hypothetical protein